MTSETVTIAGCETVVSADGNVYTYEMVETGAKAVDHLDWGAEAGLNLRHQTKFGYVTCAARSTASFTGGRVECSSASSQSWDCVSVEDYLTKYQSDIAEAGRVAFWFDAVREYHKNTVEK